MQSSEKDETQQYNFNIAAFYCFCSLDYEQINSLLEELKVIGGRFNVLGTILLAVEGFNGTICGSNKGVNEMINILKKVKQNICFDVKYSSSKNQAFRKLRIRKKAEIITMGLSKTSSLNNVGKYVEPSYWNELIDDKDTLVIDTRNDYEILVGSFENSVSPDTRSFGEFPAWVEKDLPRLIEERAPSRIAMFCTGGIRCEKATSFLKENGLKNVHHLKGGILNYFSQVPQAESRWQGECFVFDQRVSLNHDLLPGTHILCYACGLPLSLKARKRPEYIPGVQCQNCVDKFTEEDRKRFAMRQRQMEQEISF